MITADVVVVWGKELRETLRDRRTLMVMVLFPLVVYPLVSLLMVEVMAGKQAGDEARTSRVAVVASSAGVDPRSIAAVRMHLGEVGDAKAGIRATPAAPSVAATRIEIMPAAPAGSPSVLPGTTTTARAATATAAAGAAADLASNRVDAVVEVGAPPQQGAPVPIRVVFDETRDLSEKAHARVESLLAGVLPPGCDHTYAVGAASIAPKGKVGGYVLSKILPLIVILMTMLGAFYPAIDITAGERERGTLETLLSSPVHRFDLMAGKVLAVATLATITGVLNIVSMSLTVAEGARMAGGSQMLSIPWTRAGATLVTVIPAAFLFAAVMVAIGAMARSFKEAQTLLTPVYLLCFTPSLIASVADFRLSGLALFVPGTNLTLLARDIMASQVTVGAAVIVVVTTVAYGALALAFAARLYDSERLLASTDAESVTLVAWISHLVGGSQERGSKGASDSPRSSVAGMGRPLLPTPGHAIALFGVAFVLWFFVFTPLQRWRLMPGLLLSQWGGFLGLVWIYARLVRRPFRAVVALRRPNAWAFVGAALLGLSAWVILGVLADRLMPPPRQLVEEMRKLIRPPGGDRSLAFSLLALAVTPAICEEALFRGPILRGFRSSFSTPAACLLCGVLFGVLHGDIWRFLPTSLLGALLSWVALTSGSILPAMLLHVVNNGALIVLGYYRLDQATETLSTRAGVLLFAGPALAFVAGLAAVNRAREPASGGTGGKSP